MVHLPSVRLCRDRDRFHPFSLSLSLCQSLTLCVCVSVSLSPLVRRTSFRTDPKDGNSELPTRSDRCHEAQPRRQGDFGTNRSVGPIESIPKNDGILMVLNSRYNHPIHFPSKRVRVRRTRWLWKRTRRDWDDLHTVTRPDGTRNRKPSNPWLRFLSITKVENPSRMIDVIQGIRLGFDARCTRRSDELNSNSDGITRETDRFRPRAFPFLQENTFLATIVPLNIVWTDFRCSEWNRTWCAKTLPPPAVDSMQVAVTRKSSHVEDAVRSAKLPS